MSIKTHIVAALGALLVSVFAAEAGPNNFVRYNVDATLTPTGVDADATGRVQAFLKHQGSSDNRRLRVRVTHLDPNSQYTLQALVGDATDAVVVDTFTTDGAGKATLVFVENTSSRASNKPRKHRHALPEDVADLTTVRSVAIVDANNEVVLSADLHSAENLSYQVATAFTNTGNDPDAIGVMAAAVQNGTIQFRLFAMGQSSHFTLMINDEPIASYAADFTGGIAIGAYPPTAPEPMRFRQVGLKNAADVVILESNVR
jgi:hypothetical protein